MALRSERPRALYAPGPPVHARILVAEDNPVNQQVAAAMIERLGPRVDVAANGKEVRRTRVPGEEPLQLA